MGRPAAALLAAIALSACGGTTGTSTSSPAPPAVPVTSTRAATTSAPATHAVALWYLAGATPTRTTTAAPQTVAVARQALGLLLAGPPPAGQTTAIPAGTELTSVANVAGVLTAGFSADLVTAGDRNAATGQVARTGLELPGVDWVRIRSGGKDVGGLLDQQILDSADRSDHPPWIELRRAQETAGRVAYYGTADVFEATVQLRLRRNGAVVAHKTVSATCGTGCRGVFSGTMPAPAGSTGLVLEAYSLSAEDGSEQNLVRLPVT